MKSGKVLLGVLAGAAAGALLGILFAPEKGAVTRRQILQKGENYTDGLKEKFNQMANNVKEKYENVSAEAEDAFTKSKTRNAETMKDHKNGNI